MAPHVDTIIARGRAMCECRQSREAARKKSLQPSIHHWRNRLPSVSRKILTRKKSTTPVRPLEKSLTVGTRRSRRMPAGLSASLEDLGGQNPSRPHAKHSGFGATPNYLLSPARHLNITTIYSVHKFSNIFFFFAFMLLHCRLDITLIDSAHVWNTQNMFLFLFS